MTKQQTHLDSEFAVVLEKATIGYGENLLFSQLSLQIRKGELVALVGPNGAGKTTLMKVILGLKALQAGERSVLGFQHASPKDLAGKIAFVPQRVSLNRAVPLSVFEFLSLKSLPSAKDPRNGIKNILSEVGLQAEILDSSIHRLSGGQLQKVLLAFALMGEPELIVLDEATEGLDTPSQEALFRKLESLTKANKATVIVISHDISAVSLRAHRVICIHHRVLFDGDPRSPEFHICLHNIYGDKSIIHDHSHAEGSILKTAPEPV